MSGDGLSESGWNLGNWSKIGAKGDAATESNTHLVAVQPGMSQPPSAPGSVTQSPSRRGINLLDEVVFDLHFPRFAFFVRSVGS